MQSQLTKRFLFHISGHGHDPIPPVSWFEGDILLDPDFFLLISGHGHDPIPPVSGFEGDILLDPETTSFLFQVMVMTPFLRWAGSKEIFYWTLKRENS